MNLDTSSLFKANMLSDVKSTVKAQDTEAVETTETKNELDMRSIMEALTTGCTTVLSQLEANGIEYEKVDTEHGGYTITFEYCGAEYKAEYKTVNDQYQDLLNELSGAEFDSEEDFAEFCGDFYDDLTKELSSEKSDYTEYKISYSKNDKMESVTIRINHEQAAEEEPAASTVSYSDMNGDYKRQYSKDFINSLVDIGVLKDINDGNYEFDKEKAENILNEFGIDSEGIDDIFSFVNKLPKINEASSSEKTVYTDHPELFLSGTFGGPYRALNIDAVKEFFADCPDLIKTITDASSLQKAIEEKESQSSERAGARGGEPVEETPVDLEDIDIPDETPNIFASVTTEDVVSDTEEPTVSEEPTTTEEPTVSVNPTVTEEPTVVEETTEAEETASVTNITAPSPSQTTVTRNSVSTHTKPTEVENMLLLSRGIPESVVAEGVYDIDELLAVSSTSGTELFEKCYGMEASWSTESLSYMGFNIDYYLDTYFDKNSDGTYSLKKAATQDGKDGLFVEGEFVSDIQTLKDKLNIMSLEDYYNGLPIADDHNSSVDGELSSITGLRPEGYYACKDRIKKMEEKAGKTLSQAEVIFTWLTEAQASATSEASQYRVNSYLEFRLDRVKETNIENSMMYDNAFRDLSFGTLDTSRNKYDTYGYTDPQEFFTQVVYALEDDSPEKGTFNHTVWNAILKAAGVTDSDDIQTRASKVNWYIDCLTGDNEKTDYNDVFQDLMEKGCLEQNSYSLEELQQLFTDKEIEENFYLATDVSGKSLGVYRLKHDSKIRPNDVRSTKSSTLSPKECLEAGLPTNGMTVAEANRLGYKVVTTAEELKNAMISSPNVTVVLANDIDMSGIDWIPVGTEDNPFKGVIYGNGYTIRNLTVESNNQYSGLFGVFEGDAYDIKMENCTVKDTRGNDVAGMGGTGVFAGKFSGYGINIKIIDCNVQGRDNAGLLAGIVTAERKDPGIRFVTNSTGVVLEYCDTSGSVYSEYSAGGIAGMFDGVGGHRLHDCYSSADVDGQIWAGGIFGQIENAYGFNVWNGKGQDEIASLITHCVYTGENINKNIKNPPGAMGAGYTAGRMSISDEIYQYLEAKTKENENGTYPDYKLRALNNAIANLNSISSLGHDKSKIYNTYASGYNIGWLCSLNEDGSVKETQRWTKDLTGAETFGYDYREEMYITIIHGRDCGIGKCDGFDVITEEYIAEQTQADYFTDPYDGKPHKIVHTASGSMTTNNVDSFYLFTSNLHDMVTEAPEGKYAEGVTKADIDKQEQFITDPTYLDVVKQVILQNYVEHYDINNPNNQLVLDQMGDGRYLTRANYKELIEEVKARTGLTDDQLIENTINKLLSECIYMNVSDELLENGWLSSVVAAMDGEVYQTPSKEGTFYENAYVATSVPPRMSFAVGDMRYTITFNSSVPPEFVSSDELRTSLKAAGASDSQIEMIIRLYYEEAAGAYNDKTHESTIYTYYLDGLDTSRWHDLYCSFFKSTQDFVDFFMGNDDPYTHYWNALTLDEDFRSQVQQLFAGDEETGGSIQNVVRSNDSKYRTFAGLFNYTEYVFDKDGNRVKDENDNYKVNETICVWNPYTKKVVRTKIPRTCISSDGSFNRAEASKYCSDSKILDLIAMYMKHQIPSV